MYNIHSRAGLNGLYAGRVLVMTSDGRCYVGTLKACDQATNLVLDQAVERIYSTDVCFWPVAFCSYTQGESHPMTMYMHSLTEICLQEGVKVVPVGLYVVRGDHVYAL